MKPRYLFGGLFVLIGIFWITGITQLLITSVLPVQLRNPEAWAQQIYFPASAISTILYLSLLFAWIFYSAKARFASSSQAKTAITLWLLLFIASIVGNIIALVLCIQLIVVVGSSSQALLGGGTFVSVPPYEFLVPFTLINAALLFWLPSCFLTQRTLRFIPPLSFELSSLIEKR
jgi:hypothetical protein